MIEAILLAGLVILLISHRGLARRMAALEMDVARLGTAPVAESQTVPLANEPASLASPEPSPLDDIAESEPSAPLLATETQAASPAESLGSRFERLVGGRLLVWTGGIALGLAGLFLIRYSIEIGLIGPAARMVIAALFGIALIGAGEAARTRLSDDPRIGQALVGAGALVLYAAAYGSHVLYGLIGLGAAFALMAIVAAAALALSLRHGAPAAALGLVGGFLTPLLVGNSALGAVPMLGYLALLNLAVFVVARRTRRRWLARAAQALTLLWTASLLFPTLGDQFAVGLFLLVYAVASSFALEPPGERWPAAAASFALLQLGVVVAADGYRWPGWWLFLGLAAAGIVSRNAVLARLPARALPVALLLLAAHAATVMASAAIGAIAACVTVLFAGGGWWRLERSQQRLGPAWLVCVGTAGPTLVLRVLDAGLLPRAGWGVLLVVLAAIPAALAWRLRAEAREDPPFDPALLLAAASAGLLVGAGALDLAGPSWLPLVWLLIALAIASVARRIGDGGLARLAIVGASLGSLAAAARVPGLWDALVASLAGVPVLIGDLASPGEAALLFAAPALVWLALWRALRRGEDGLARFAGAGAAGLAMLTLYILYKQLFALGDGADVVARGFAERTLLTQALFFAGWLLARRPRLAALGPVALALTALAAARFAWFDLLILNPVAVTQNVGATPILNLLAPAYLGSAFWLFEARRRADLAGSGPGPRGSLFFALFLAALVAGVGLLVRQLFHGAILTGPELPRAEFYGYSLGGLVLSVGLLVAGWRRQDTPMRVAGLALLTAAVVKVFAVDAAALEGILRILSFLGLGVALIGMGKLYGTLLGRGTASGGDESGAATASPRP